MMTTLPRPRAAFSEKCWHSSRINSIGNSAFSGGRAAVKKSGCVPASIWTQDGQWSHASSRPSSRGRLAQQRLGQFDGEQPFADAGRADEEVGVGQPAAPHRPRKRLRLGLMPAHALPGHAPPPAPRPPPPPRPAGPRPRRESDPAAPAPPPGTPAAPPHDERRRGPRCDPPAASAATAASSTGKSSTMLKSGSSPPVANSPSRQSSAGSRPPA